jgi:hypothetical protein
MVRACRNIVVRACRRCTETIRMKNKEDIGVAIVESDSGEWKEECVATEIQRRGMVH